MVVVLTADQADRLIKKYEALTERTGVPARWTEKHDVLAGVYTSLTDKVTDIPTGDTVVYLTDTEADRMIEQYEKVAAAPGTPAQWKRERDGLADVYAALNERSCGILGA